MNVLPELRIALRGLIRSKGFALAGSLTLALGIGDRSVRRGSRGDVRARGTGRARGSGSRSPL